MTSKSRKGRRGGSAKEARRSSSQDSLEDRDSASASSPDGYPPLTWRRESPKPPSNSERARLAVVIALLVGWIVILGWLVWDSH